MTKAAAAPDPEELEDDSADEPSAEEPQKTPKPTRKRKAPDAYTPPDANPVVTKAKAVPAQGKKPKAEAPKPKRAVAAKTVKPAGKKAKSTGQGNKASASEQAGLIASLVKTIVDVADPKETKKRDDFANQPHRPGQDPKPHYNWIANDKSKEKRLSLVKLYTSHNPWELLSQTIDKHTGVTSVTFVKAKDIKMTVGSLFRTEFPSLVISDITLFKVVTRELDAEAVKMAQEAEATGQGVETEEELTPYREALQQLLAFRNSFVQLKAESKGSKVDNEKTLDEAGEISLQAAAGIAKRYGRVLTQNKEDDLISSSSDDEVPSLFFSLFLSLVSLPLALSRSPRIGVRSVCPVHL